mgnify:CR=1 FL=1
MGRTPPAVDPGLIAGALECLEASDLRQVEQDAAQLRVVLRHRREHVADAGVHEAGR